MKKALISPDEDNVVADISDVVFDVAAPLFWLDCPDNVEARRYRYDEDKVAFVEIPIIPPAPTVPIAVSPWQIRKALNQTGLRDAIESAIAVADQTPKDAWEYATEFRRDNPLVSQMGAILGKTEADLDALFILAKSL